VTTEHFTLQGARSSTISESTGRASVFLGAASGGLIALGLVASAAKTGVAFYMFGLILLPTLAFVGLATFHRVLQSGIEDLRYARRIAQLLSSSPGGTSRSVRMAARSAAVAGDGGLRDDDRPDREQSAQPCPQWVGLLTVVQEHQPHPHASTSPRQLRARHRRAEQPRPTLPKVATVLALADRTLPQYIRHSLREVPPRSGLVLGHHCRTPSRCQDRQAHVGASHERCHCLRRPRPPSPCAAVSWPITDEGVAFGSDTAVGMMPAAHSRRGRASVLAVVIRRPEVSPMNAVSTVGAPLQSTIARLR
jgi:hypothetical protein